MSASAVCKWDARVRMHSWALDTVDANSRNAAPVDQALEVSDDGWTRTIKGGSTSAPANAQHEEASHEDLHEVDDVNRHKLREKCAHVEFNVGQLRLGHKGYVQRHTAVHSARRMGKEDIQTTQKCSRTTTFT